MNNRMSAIDTQRMARRTPTNGGKADITQTGGNVCF
jgi:hypothetical protein